jgi:hypothetical protein
MAGMLKMKALRLNAAACPSRLHPKTSLHKTENSAARSSQLHPKGGSLLLNHAALGARLVFLCPFFNLQASLG